jgi:hypothetical protein
MKKKGYKIILVTIGAIIGAFILLIVLINIFVPEEELQKSAQARAERKKATIEEGAKQEALKAEIERKKIAPEEMARQEALKAEEMAKKETAKVEDSIKKIFEAKKAGDSGVVSIRYAKPNCTVHYDLFPLGLFKYEDELGMKLMPKIKKLYQKHAEIENVIILIRGPFQDRYGNMTWEPVVSFEFTRDVLNQINWSRFFNKDLLKVAENVVWHRKS